MKKYLLILIIALIMPRMAMAHCQIPCGIYDDELRFEALEEDVATIKKSIAQINLISASNGKDFNQLVRWVNNKEEYSNKIIDVMSNYFLAQRIKPDHKNYEKMLKSVHNVIVFAMKNKQNSDVKIADELQNNLDELRSLYIEKKHEH